MIAAGELDRRIRFEEAGEARDPSTRELVRTWPPEGGVLIAEVAAARLEETGREMRTARQTWAELEVGWKIRWKASIEERVSPTDRFRVVERGRVFDLVTQPYQPAGTRRTELLVFAKGRAE